MDLLATLKDSFEIFFRISLFSALPIFVCTKYQYRKQVSVPAFLLIIGMTIFVEFLYTIFVGFFYVGSSFYAFSNEAIKTGIIVFLLILLLYFKGVPLFKAILEMGIIYLVVTFSNQLFFSFAPIDINQIIPQIVALILVTGLSFLLSIFCLKMLTYLNQKLTHRSIYSPYTVGAMLLVFLGTNLSNMLLVRSSEIELPSTTDSQVPQNNNGDIFLFLFVLFLITTTIILVNSYLKEQKIRFQSERTKELENYIEAIEIIRDEVLSYQHDYDNIFSGISGYLYRETVNLEELKKYYEKSSEKVLNNKGIQVIKLLNLKNIEIPEVKGILSQKILKARQQAISIHLEVNDPVVDIQMDKVDLTRCLGILLDNAIEAASLSEKKELIVAFISLETQVVVVIKNSVSNQQKQMMEFNQINNRFTSKQDRIRHGFGLLNVQKIVKDYEHIQLRTMKSDNEFTQEMRIGRKVGKV